MHRASFARSLSALLAFAIGFVGLAPALPPAAAAAAPAPLASSRIEPQPAPKQVVVKWAPGVQAAQIAGAAERAGFKVVRTSRALGWSLAEPTRAGMTADSLVTALRRTGLVERAHVERIYKATSLPTPNDPLYAQQWALHNSGQASGTAGDDISAAQAWTRSTGSKSIVVAVVDTGMDWQHADLRANIWTNPKEIPGNGIDDDHDGYVDDAHGYDFGNRDSTLYDPMDGDQHGTHVAGIIGAAGNNATGVAGVNWNVTIMPVKFLVMGSGTDFDGAEAIHYAVDNGADVINCSWGGSEPSDLLDEAIDYAAKHGVLVITAAGNDGSDVGEYPDYPGCIDSTAIVNVAATDNNDELAYFSNYGKKVDLAAPGVDVTSTLPFECAGVFVDKFPYRVSYLAFPLEEVRPSAVASRILSRSLMQLSPMTDNVMVVDDSTPEVGGEDAGQRLGEYVANLGVAGYSGVTTWSVEAQGAPSAATMAGKTVIWFTGARMPDPFSAPLFTRQALTQLGAFLDSGGRLLLSSGEAVDDLLWSEQGYMWMRDYLHVDFMDFLTWGSDLKGFDDTPFEGLAGHLDQPYTSSGEYAMAGSDSIMPADDYAKPIIGLGGYGPLSGTSMAAPHVTGAAALLMAAMPTATPAEVRDRLVGTTDPRPQLAHTTAQGGRLNVWAAMQDYASRPTITQPRTGTVLHGGHDQQLAWKLSPSSSAEATFEAQLGLQTTAFAEDFESGTLGPFVTSSGADAWTTTSTAHAGSFAISNGAGLGYDLSSAWTTVTVPEGGGELAFWYRYEGDWWSSYPMFSLDTTDNIQWMPDALCSWTEFKLQVPEGTHRLIWSYNQDPWAPRTIYSIDDITLTGFDFQPLASAAAGARDVTFTVPATDTPHVRLRVRSNLHDRHSAWSEEVDVRISSDDSPPSTPGSFHAVAGSDGDATLAWTNPSAGDGAKVRVLRRLDTTPTGPDDPQATVVYEGTALGCHDVGMRNGVVAHYAAFAIDPAENASDGAFASAAISDTTAPGAIRGMQAGMTEGVVGICWLPPASAETSSVRLMRRTDTTPTGPNDPSAVLVYEGSATSARDFLLTQHAFSGTAYYAAYPFDRSGNVGPRSAVSLRVDSAMRGTFTLNNDALYSRTATVTAVSAVPAAVRVRFNLGDGWGAWQPYAASKTLVLAPPLDGLHVVQAEYENASGDRLQLTANIFLEVTPPSPPVDIKAQPWSHSVKLTWSAPPEEDVAGYNVYAATNPIGPYRAVASAEPSSAMGYVLPGGTGYSYFKVTAYDIANLESVRSDTIACAPGPGVTRVAGPSRYATAIEVSKKHFASADTVVLATGENFADALSASGLAGSYEAPILLTRQAALAPGVGQELARLGAKRVLLIGGTSAISADVAKSLEASYTVKRISGPDRYSTAVAVARELAAHETTPPTAAAIVNGASFADGTSIAAVAYANHMPVLLTRTDSLPTTTSAMIAHLDLQDLYIIGGPAAVGFEVEDALPMPAMRIGGSNRYETSEMIAEMFTGLGMAKLEYAAVASGRTYPDALTGGAAAGKEGGVVLLTQPAFPSDEMMMLMYMRGMEFDRVEVLGGTSAVSAVVPQAIQEALDQGGPILPPDEFGPGDEGDWGDGGPYPPEPWFRH